MGELLLLGCVLCTCSVCGKGALCSFAARGGIFLDLKKAESLLSERDKKEVSVMGCGSQHANSRAAFHRLSKSQAKRSE